MISLILCLLLTSVYAEDPPSESAGSHAEPLFIGAFNIQIFGQSKMDKPDAVATLVKIVQRYDILMIQEIRDSAQTALPELIREVNAVSDTKYGFISSPRTGRSSSKEQYGYIYKESKVSINGVYQYPDSSDVFEREPYTVNFERRWPGAQQNFSFIGIHAKPDDADEEISNLVKVYDEVIGIYGEDALIGGDFNADCSYVCKSCWENIDLWTESRFTWLIPHDADTTLSSKDCAYDRLVVAGDSMTENSSQGEVFYFDEAYGLTQEEAEEVSDHYPVEFYLS